MLPSPVRYVSQPRAAASSIQPVMPPAPVTIPIRRAGIALRCASGAARAPPRRWRPGASHPPSNVPWTPAERSLVRREPALDRDPEQPRHLVAGPVGGRAVERGVGAVERHARRRRARRACAHAGHGRCTATTGDGRGAAARRPPRRARSTGRSCSRPTRGPSPRAPASTTRPFSGSSDPVTRGSSSASSQRGDLERRWHAALSRGMRSAR